MTVCGPGFWCSGSSCSFKRGSAIDLVIETAGLETALSAAEKNGCPFNGDKVEKRRKLTKFFQDREDSFSDLSAERISLIYRAQTIGVSTTHTRNGVWYLTGKESRILADLVPPSQVSRIPPGGILAVPYWADRHTVSEILVIGRDTSRPRFLKIEPFKFSWYGLPQAPPSCATVSAWPDYVSATRSAKLKGLFTPGILTTHFRANPEARRTGFVPEKAIVHSPRAWWPSELSSWSHMEGLSSCSYSTVDENSGETVSTQSFDELYEAVCREQFSSGDPEAFAGLLGSYDLDRRRIEAAISICVASGKYGAAAILERSLDRKRIFSSEGVAVYSSLAGYEVEKGDSSKVVGNFTLDFNELVYFSAYEDTILSGTMHIGPEDVPFAVESKKIDNPASLERALQPMQLASGTATDTPLATIYDRRAFKELGPYFQKTVSVLKRIPGTRFLGWSRRHDSFSTPFGKTGPGEFAVPVKFHARDGSGMDVFEQSGKTPETVQPDTVSFEHPEAAEIIAIAAAVVCRFFHGLPVRPVPVKNTTESRVFMKWLFAGIGQRDWFRPGNTLPKTYDDLRGMPCCMDGLNDMQARRVPAGGFYKSETGMLVTLSPEDCPEAPDVLRTALHSAARALMAGELDSFEPVRSASLKTSYGKEGSMVLKAAGLSGWPEPGVQYPVIDSVLEEKEADLARHVVSDSKNGEMILKDSLWEGRCRDDFAIELGLLTKKIRMEERYIAVDQVSGHRILEDFYGTAPVLAPPKKGQKV